MTMFDGFDDDDMVDEVLHRGLAARVLMGARDGEIEAELVLREEEGAGRPKTADDLVKWNEWATQ